MTGLLSVVVSIREYTRSWIFHVLKIDGLAYTWFRTIFNDLIGLSDSSLCIFELNERGHEKITCAELDATYLSLLRVSLGR